jgi:NADH:ubiquinone oxidoreductase subunit E
MTSESVEVTKKDPLEIPAQREMIDAVIAENKAIAGAPMVVLNEIQNCIGYISPAMERYIAQELNVPMSQIHGVVSFYSFFTTQPRGQHIIKFCLGTACYVGGAPQLIEKAKQVLGVDIGDTTSDWKITLDVCRCIGACSQAPAVMVDDDVYGRVTPNQLPKIIRQYQ